MLQEDAMQKLSKTVMRPRFPREWLGRETVDGIRRLVTSSSIGHVEDRCIKSKPIYTERDRDRKTDRKRETRNERERERGRESQTDTQKDSQRMEEGR